VVCDEFPWLVVWLCVTTCPELPWLVLAWLVVWLWVTTCPELPCVDTWLDVCVTTWCLGFAECFFFVVAVVVTPAVVLVVVDVPVDVLLVVVRHAPTVSPCARCAGTAGAATTIVNSGLLCEPVW
jgi:hypothetical protein